MKQRKSPFVGTLSLAMMLLAGCSQEVVINDSPNAASGKYIGFNPLTERSDTRAQLIDDDNLENFAVWAAPDLSAVSSDADYTLQNVLVYRDEATWTYKPSVLWPATSVDFYAFAPGLSKNVLRPMLFPLYTPTLTYDVPVENEAGKIKQEDFLIAKKSDATSAGGTVTLQFQHALSRVVFRAKSALEKTDLLIYKVTLHNLYSQGTINFSTADIPEDRSFRAANKYADDDHDPLFTLWTNLEDRQNYDLPITQDATGAGSSAYTPVMVDNTMKQIHTNANALMVMPQTTTLATINTGTGAVTNDAAGAFYITVNWALSSDPLNDRDTSFPVAFPDSKATTGGTGKGTDLFDPKPLAFEIGRQYTFDITLTEESGVNIITMKPQVSDWDDFTTITDGTTDTDGTEIPVPHYSVGDVYDPDPTDDTTDNPTTDPLILVYEADANGKPTKLAYFRNTAININIDPTEIGTALGGGDLGDTFVEKFTANLNLPASQTIDLGIQPTDAFWHSVDMKEVVTNHTVYKSNQEILVLNSVTEDGRPWANAMTFPSAMADGSSSLNTIDYWLFDGSDASLTTTYKNQVLKFSIAGSTGIASFNLMGAGLTLDGYVTWSPNLTTNSALFTISNADQGKLIMYVVEITE
jgi:hypothetical protein